MQAARSSEAALRESNANDISGVFGPDQAWDIVDAQLHFSRGTLTSALFAMDALGIGAALLDEFWDVDADGTIRPGFQLPNGATRTQAWTAAAAAAEHPDRFAYFLRVDHRDPELAYVVENVAADPGGRGLRLVVFGADEFPMAFRAGEYGVIFEAARKHGLPVFVTNAGRPKDILVYASAFPDVTIVVEHVGMPVTGNEVDLKIFDDVLALADHANVALKWSHAPQVFKTRGFPLDALTPFLLKALQAFGPERLMWASDISMVRTGHSWAELLFSIRENPALSVEERQWILGGTVRTLLKWPAR